MPEVSVAYGFPGGVDVVTVSVAPGATLEDAIRASGVLERRPEIDLQSADVGVFNRLRRLSDPVRDGDRVEIYRPLTADPKEARRRRAARNGGTP